MALKIIITKIIKRYTTKIGMNEGEYEI